MKPSPQSYDPATGEALPPCAHCGAAMVGGHWFCRLHAPEGPILLCSPSCALRYFDISYTPPFGWDCDDDDDDRRIVVLVHDQIAGFRMSSNHHYPQPKWTAH